RHRLDRHYPADWNREKERHPHDRLCARSRTYRRETADCGDLPGRSAPLPPHHDDDYGSAPGRTATRTRTRGRLRTPPSAWHHDCRRTHRKPNAHLIYHTGDLLLPG